MKAAALPTITIVAFAGSTSPLAAALASSGVTSASRVA